MLQAISWALTLAMAPHGDALVRVHTPSQQSIDTLHELGFDVWTEAPNGDLVDVRVPQTERPRLDVTGLDYELLVPDLGPRVEAERTRLSTSVSQGGDEALFFADYQRLEHIEARLDTLATLRSDLVIPLTLGPSLEGRALRGLQISAAPKDAPVFFINAGQHAREWIAIAATTCVADRLVRDAETERVRAMLEQLRVIIVPVVNPDGYVFSWDEDRYWRKNRRPPDGVDLNRNFPTAWGGLGASDNPRAGNYHGEGPFSEPEARAIRDLVETFGTLRAHLDVHAYGELVLYPWGFAEVAAPDEDALATAAEVLAGGMTLPHATNYIPIPGSALYPAAGNIMDWSYGEYGAFAYGLELRPDGETEFPEGFVLPPDQILPVCEELTRGVLDVAEHVLESSPLEAGDDGAATSADTGETSSSGGPGAATSTGLPSEETTGASPSGGTGSSTPDDDNVPTTSGSTTGEAAGEDEATPETEGCGCHAPKPTGALLPLLGLLLHRRRKSS